MRDKPRPSVGTEPRVERLEDVVRGVLTTIRIPYLLERLPTRPVMAVFATVNGFLSIAIMSLAALLTDQPFVFPSLGPTAFLFFYSPLVPAASPRNTLIGHLIGASAGFACLVAFGLQDSAPSTVAGVTTERVLAAGLSLGLTSGLMVLVHAPHPPAGATTLIISLGVLHEFDQVVVLMLAVALLTVQAIAINRLAGLHYPLWKARAT